MMSSTIILSEAIIDDSDLCLPQKIIQRYHEIEKLLESDSDSHSDEDIESTFDDSLDIEKQLMKSMGLPIEFDSNRSMNRRQSHKRKTISYPRHEQRTDEINGINCTEDMNQSFLKFWSECGLQCADKSWVEKYSDYQYSDHLSDCQQNGENSEELSETDWWQQLWENHCSEEYNLQYNRFVSRWPFGQLAEDFQVLPKMLTNFKLSDNEINEPNDGNGSNESKSESNGSLKDNNTNEAKETKSEDLKQLITTSSSICNSLLNDGSDGDEPPEERPTRVKREHESDGIEVTDEEEKWQEMNETIVETKVKSVPKKRKSSSNQKYWHQRYRLFSRFDSGIKLDDESWYSVTPERIAEHIAKRFNGNYLIVDAFCGAGGNTIQFALISELVKVIAIDIDETKVSLAKHNAKIYGVDHRIEFIVGDYMLLAKTGAFKAEAVFLSPPWGGPNYLNKKNYTLDMMTPNGVDVFQVTNTYITPNIGILLPRNIDRNQLNELPGYGESVEVEENRVNNKVKTVTAYFGNLIHCNQ